MSRLVIHEDLGGVSAARVSQEGLVGRSNKRSDDQARDYVLERLVKSMLLSTDKVDK